MARYEHLPIYRAAFDLAVHLEKIVKSFSRYHKYTLGSELRDGSRRVLRRIIEANEAREASDRRPALEVLRREIEQLKVTARLAQESEAFASTRAYLHVAEQVVGIARQNEGWLRKAQKTGRKRQETVRSGEAGHGQSRAG